MPLQKISKIRDRLIIQKHRINGRFIMNMLFDTYTVNLLYTFVWLMISDYKRGMQVCYSQCGMISAYKWFSIGVIFKWRLKNWMILITKYLRLRYVILNVEWAHPQRGMQVLSYCKTLIISANIFWKWNSTIFFLKKKKFTLLKARLENIFKWLKALLK